MITVLKVNRQRMRIIYYTCTDGNQTLHLTREQLIESIKRNRVTNASLIQCNGNNTIRIKGRILPSGEVVC